MSDEGLILLEGTVLLDDDCESFSAAVLDVCMEEVGRCGTPVRTISQLCKKSISHNAGGETLVRFTLRGAAADPAKRYAVRARLRLQRHGSYLASDCLNSERCPVLTFGQPYRVALKLKQDDYSSFRTRQAGPSPAAGMLLRQ